MDYIRLTEETRRWFTPLLDQELTGLWTAPQHYALGAVEAGKALGLLIFAWSAGRADIVYLAVADSNRRQGVATGLVQHLCRQADIQTVPVTCSFAASGKGDPLYLFFASMDNFTVAEDEGGVYRLPFHLMRQSRRLAGFLSNRPLRPFFALPEGEQAQFRTMLAKKKIWYGQDWSGRRPKFVQPLCLCMGERAIEAAVFVEELTGNDLLLAFVWQIQQQKQLFALLAEVEKRIAEMQKEGALVIAAATPAVQGLIYKLYPQAHLAEQYFQAAWDMAVREGE